MAATFIERETNGRVLRRGNRLIVRRFADSESAYKFLATGANGLDWRISTKGLKAGTYAYAGGRWHNVKSLDPCALAHI